ncbi:hypothetical protein N0V95_003361 [Ascochyta clinopodiicola]|nr:hypothetical protein N0V95_003361 [Ascochyta clinopodiicola]
MAEYLDLKPGTGFDVYANGLTNASSAKVKELGRSKYIEQSKKPPPLPTDTELNFSTTGLKVLFVGMRPTDAAKHTKVTATDARKDDDGQTGTKKRKTGKGKSVQAQQDALVVPYDTEATRVVVPFDKQNVNYYVLLGPGTFGLCQGLSCDGEEVFFFKEFRDDVAATSLGKRKIATTKAIRAAANIQVKAAPKAIDTTIAQITEAKSAHNEIVALVTTYLVDGDSSLLAHCKKLLESQVDDNGERNSHLMTLLRGEEDISDEKAQQAKEDIEVNLSLTSQVFKANDVFRPHGQLGKISTSSQLSLTSATTSSCLAIHFRYAHATLILAIKHLRVQPEEFDEQIVEILDDCKLQIGTEDAMPGDEVGLCKVAPLRALFDALVHEVKGTRATNAKQMEALKSYAGARLTVMRWKRSRRGWRLCLTSTAHD